MKKSIVVASRGRNPNNPSDRKTKSNRTFVQMLETPTPKLEEEEK